MHHLNLAHRPCDFGLHHDACAAGSLIKAHMGEPNRRRFAFRVRDYAFFTPEGKHIYSLSLCTRHVSWARLWQRQASGYTSQEV